MFVIAAIFLERNLQSVANYLIVSLAVADLMVACLVMPLGAVYEVRSGNGIKFLKFRFEKKNIVLNKKKKSKDSLNFLLWGIPEE